MHISPKRGIGRIPKCKRRISVQKPQNDMTRTEGSVWTSCHPVLITSADYTADHQHSAQTQRHGSSKLSCLISRLNQINNTVNLDSGQFLLAFNRVRLIFGQSKLAKNEMWPAFCPLTKWLFSLRSHRRGWSWSISVRPGLASVWEHPAVFEVRSSHSHWPWTICSPPATIVQIEKTEMVSRLSLE